MGSSEKQLCVVLSDIMVLLALYPGLPVFFNMKSWACLVDLVMLSDTATYLHSLAHTMSMAIVYHMHLTCMWRYATMSNYVTRSTRLSNFHTHKTLVCIVVAHSTHKNWHKNTTGLIVNLDFHWPHSLATPSFSMLHTEKAEKAFSACNIEKLGVARGRG